MNDQQFVLRWHYHDTTLLNNLPCFLENDFLTDVVLSVGQHQLKAHKIILAMCSSYFFQLFQEISNQHPVIVLHNVTIEDLKAILAFIYKGQCVVSKDHLPSLLSVAKLLKIQGLCDMKVPESPTLVQNDNVNEFDNTTQENSIKEISKICDSIIEKTTTTTTTKIQQINNKLINKKDVMAVDLMKNNNNKKLNGNDEKLINKKPIMNKEVSETCKCFLCGKYLSNQYNLRVHMETHEEAFHACHSCPHVSRSRDALRKHVSYRHPEEYQTRKRKKIDNV